MRGANIMKSDDSRLSEIKQFKDDELAKAERMVAKINQSAATYQKPFYHAGPFSIFADKNAELLGYINMFCTTQKKDAYGKLEAIMGLLNGNEYKSMASHLISHLKKDGVTAESVRLAARQYAYTPTSSPTKTGPQVETPPSRSDNESPKV
jgi:hypothetical protein